MTSLYERLGGAAAIDQAVPRRAPWLPFRRVPGLSDVAAAHDDLHPRQPAARRNWSIS